MSITQTLANPQALKPKAHTHTTQLLSPGNRKHLSPSPEPSPSSVEASQRKAKDVQVQACPIGQTLRSKILECRRNTKLSSSDLYKWTLNQSSVTPVRAKHIFEMDRVESDCSEFYWMGRVPCRTVKVVGIVVGIDEFDDMTRFKLDDGTAVIDCDFKHPREPKRPQPLTPKTERTKIASNYAPPETSKASSFRKDKVSKKEEMPKVTVTVGSLLSVQGRIFQGRGSRYLRIEPGRYSICDSANDEPRHWMDVNRLCHEYYYLPEPFVIPTMDQQPQITEKPATGTPNPLEPSSPFSVASPSGTEYSRSSTAPPRHPRLRHPSRLHSRDLTDVTFRIYVKHFMDFAPSYRPVQGTFSLANHNDDSDQTRFHDSPMTPTPKSRYKFRCYSSLETPKPRRQGQAQSSKGEMIGQEDVNKDNVQYGFTLGYLRRVPVLAEMARAVVHAEGKRRDKEERRKQQRESRKEYEEQHPQHCLCQNGPCASLTRESFCSSASNRSRTGPCTCKMSTSSMSQKLLSEPQLVSRNMKRLFQKTIRDLYRDGNIVIWNGPSRPLENALYADGTSLGESSDLWKTGMSSESTSLPSTATTDTTTSCTIYGRSKSKSTQDESSSLEDGYLSDPNEDEECYLPVTAHTIAPFILRALRTLTGVVDSSDARLRKKSRRPSADEITVYLQKSDAQWANLGSWDVQVALEWLQNEDRVFKAGDGWALSGS